MSLRIGLVYDLRSDYLAAGYSEEETAEFDSEVTIEALEQTIRSLGYPVERVGNARALCARLVAGDRWDLVFNIAEGLEGRSREAQVPCLLELYRVPYTFSDPLVAAVSMDKAMTKRIVRGAGLNTPDFIVVNDPADVRNCRLKLPLFAKPIAEGTGKGVDQRSCIESVAQLEAVCSDLLGRFRQPVLVEEFLPGREFTVGVVGTGGAARVIGTMEINFLPQAGKNIYSFEAKEQWEQLVRYAPVKDVALRNEVECLCLAAYRELECRDAGRADIRLDALGRPAFMEINTLPGLRPGYSDLPLIAAQEGMPYATLIGSIIESAKLRM